MREARRRRLPRYLIALIAAIALSSVVLSSATGLGGLRTQDLGGAAASTQLLDGVSLSWKPTWQNGGWRVGEVGVTADPARGFRAEDEVRLTIAGAQPCEIVTDVTAATGSLTLDAARLTAACAALPALTATTAVALAVTGADGASSLGNLGGLTGSLAGFAGRAATTATATATANAGVVSSVVVDVAGAVPAQLGGARVLIARTTASGVETFTTAVGTATPVSGGARISIDLSGQRWSTLSAVQLDVAISLPQVLGGGVSAAAGTALARVTVPAGATPAPDPGGGTDDGGGGSTPPPPATTGNALVPVTVSPGMSYRYHTPWTGVQTNVLTFCHEFTVTNTTSRALGDWTVTFNTKLAPMWGMNPTAAGTVTLDNIATRSFDAKTGYWTVGGSNDWARKVEAGGSRTVRFCATSVPTPPVNPALYDVKVSVVPQGDWYVTFRVKVTSTSEFYVPWRAEVDLAQLVCGTSLAGRPITFSQVVATPVPGSTTRYVLQGTPGDTQLVSASHSREITFAAYGPGPGWRLPCAQG
ncbi:hypothetical protein [Pseudactinotalea suaedae]|uniref:hypothetical protein n=1 Tax=Pseudactinotalea suaedae TaxID=1524924 RepID=UPI0012E242C8|nr:hypothetical protein [Pseudactinotalea suaedae]